VDLVAPFDAYNDVFMCLGVLTFFAYGHVKPHFGEETTMTYLPQYVNQLDSVEATGTKITVSRINIVSRRGKCSHLTTGYRVLL
jgi:hypothetical protein